MKKKEEKKTLNDYSLEEFKELDYDTQYSLINIRDHKSELTKYNEIEIFHFSDGWGLNIGNEAVINSCDIHSLEDIIKALQERGFMKSGNESKNKPHTISWDLYGCQDVNGKFMMTEIKTETTPPNICSYYPTYSLDNKLCEITGKECSEELCPRSEKEMNNWLRWKNWENAINLISNENTNIDRLNERQYMHPYWINPLDHLKAFGWTACENNSSPSQISGVVTSQSPGKLTITTPINVKLDSNPLPIRSVCGKQQYSAEARYCMYCSAVILPATEQKEVNIVENIKNDLKRWKKDKQNKNETDRKFLVEWADEFEYFDKFIPLKKVIKLNPFNRYERQLKRYIINIQDKLFEAGYWNIAFYKSLHTISDEKYIISPEFEEFLIQHAAELKENIFKYIYKRTTGQSWN